MMKKEKCYVSGAISKHDNIQDAIDNFSRACQIVEKNGFSPINPFDIVPNDVFNSLQGTEREKWIYAMKEDLKVMLEQDIKHIALIPDFKESEGAMIEFSLAQVFGYEMFLIDFEKEKLEKLVVDN